jgi:ribose 1,5-bisphosphokinase PhnN
MDYKMTIKFKGSARLDERGRATDEGIRNRAISTIQTAFRLFHVALLDNSFSFLVTADQVARFFIRRNADETWNHLTWELEEWRENQLIDCRSK